MILLSGSNGHLGRLTAAAFQRLGATGDVVLGSRDPAKLADLADQGFATRAFDFEDPEGMRTALAGIDTLAMISGEAPDDGAQHGKAIEAAKAAGVKNILYTSYSTPTAESKFAVAPKHYGTEQRLAASGLNVTLMRNGFYAENLDPQIAQARQTGVLAMGAPEARYAYAPRAEFAEALARAALDPALQGRAWTLTGPIAPSGAEIAAAIAEASGRPVTLEGLDPAQQKAGLEAAGLPDFVVALALSVSDAAAAGEFAEVSPDLETILGRRPRSLIDYIKG